MDEVILDLKIPTFSVNKMHYGRHVKSKAYRAWQTLFWASMVEGEQKKTYEQTRAGTWKYYSVQLVFEMTPRMIDVADVDNPVKAILDGLVNNDIIRDDWRVRCLHVTKVPAKKPSMRIVITQWGWEEYESE